MGDVTGIAWTDSTWNPWVGCIKVGPGCDNCYAEKVGKRMQVAWGAGLARKRTSEANWKAPLAWNRNAEKFHVEHGRRRRVFCASLADVFDNEVPDDWRAEAFALMEATHSLLWQICTKRVSNVDKMVPVPWKTAAYDRGFSPVRWPHNVGLLITTVTEAEVRRDVPRLLALKMRFGIPWVGLSIEPLIEDVSFALREVLAAYPAGALDWAILGGESGPGARRCDLAWILDAMRLLMTRGTAVFVKQLGANPTYIGDHLRLADSHGGEPGEWPDLDLVRSFPRALL